MGAALAVIDATESAAVLLDATRMRILEQLREPESAAGVARVLELPRQRVAYHVKELEKAGLVRHVTDRRKRNCVERVVQATARRYVIAPQALGALGVASPDEIADRFSSSYLVAVAAQAIRDVATLQAGARDAGKQLPTITMQADVRFASAADQSAFAQELADSVARLAAKYHDGRAGGAGRTFHFTVLGHPAAPPAPRT